MVRGLRLSLLGTVTVILLFAWLAYRGFTITYQAPDTLGKLMAVGVTTWITLQAILHIGVVTGSVPPTGLPLPLVSYGGSSMLVTLAAIGLLINIWRACVSEGTLDANDHIRWWDWRPYLPSSGSR